ncbi:hypothetical protein SAMN05444397_10529 [Flavobacterium aquidurense]|uniref:Uncharacterized protein n=1 Tax=Flavobacterium frigidimaris TaxID=262320 RepID=A0ABX4BTD9_FLAFR|nr:hypothetical protein [Flavobacterium frigidimaris]OXA80147.1 hypothetical protein B0A65_07415 [Flavobacterium frigidimaris]SDZ28995.1 hypothetical protein SAMN05444397_10529 [Flavobacterium aquidurense]
MKEEDKNIKNLIDKMMAEDTLEVPSFDFTSKIMAQVLVAEKSKIKAYKPLISKSTWIFIGFSLLGLAIYASLFSGTPYNLGIDKSYTERFSAVFSGIHLSKNIMYAILVVPFMILIQIGLLKNYFDKKYQL